MNQLLVLKIAMKFLVCWYIYEKLIKYGGRAVVNSQFHYEFYQCRTKYLLQNPLVLYFLKQIYPSFIYALKKNGYCETVLLTYVTIGYLRCCCDFKKWQVQRSKVWQYTYQLSHGVILDFHSINRFWQCLFHIVLASQRVHS